jgi:hypothetical protein
MILKGFGFVAFFAGVKASSFCIHLSCLVCSLSVVRGELSRLFCGHKGRNLPEVSVNSFLLPQFFLLRTAVYYLIPSKTVAKGTSCYGLPGHSVLGASHSGAYVITG